MQSDCFCSLNLLFYGVFCQPCNFGHICAFCELLVVWCHSLYKGTNFLQWRNGLTLIRLRTTCKWFRVRGQAGVPVLWPWARHYSRITCIDPGVRPHLTRVCSPCISQDATEGQLHTYLNDLFQVDR